MMQQRQNVKKLKLKYESLNLDKNRQLKELKKSRVNLRQSSKYVNQGLMQEEEMKSEILLVQKVLQEQRKRLCLRSRNKESAFEKGYFSKVMNMLKVIRSFQRQEVQVGEVIDRIMVQQQEKHPNNKQVSQSILLSQQFQKMQRQCNEYIMNENKQLKGLVNEYEKRFTIQKNKEQESKEYKQRKHENKLLRQMLTILVNNEINIHIGSSIDLYGQLVQDQRNKIGLNQIGGYYNQEYKSYYNENNLQDGSFQFREKTNNFQQNEQLSLLSRKTLFNTSNINKFIAKITTKATYTNH